ncbi:MAG: hypothetical protein JWO42_2259 [Chloroflexi bacterium]|nr:hypothetical protein [Chloroflexota bacterium]
MKPALISAVKNLHLAHDPGRVAFRRAARAAIVIPLALSVAMRVVGNVQFTTFVVFGCFSLLVLADFGGPRRQRALAYLTTVLFGAILVTIGTLASTNPRIGAVAMLIVAFCVQFSGIFGSYISTARPALLLSFVLSVATPATAAAIGPRVSGWLAAGAVATLAGTLLWPHVGRQRLLDKAAAACRAIATLIEATREETGRDIAKLRQIAADSVAVVRKEYAGTPNRPEGTARRGRAFVELMTQQNRLVALSSRQSQVTLPAEHACHVAGDTLALAVVRTLESSAEVLKGGTPPDLKGLERARLGHWGALDIWATDAMRAGVPAEKVIDNLTVDSDLRATSYVTFALGTNAILAAGKPLDASIHAPTGTPRQTRLTGFVTQIARRIRTHLDPASSVLHSSIRIAFGLALAVLVAGLLGVSHGFWVVLGALSVLRSNALATGRTSIQAIAGTVLGFIVAALFVLTIGSSTVVLWIALPVLVFTASYAASAAGFLAGQVAFTVLVIVLFNLIAPSGWQVGLVRVEDVALGVGISVVTGLLLWPRGAGVEFRQSLGGCYEAVSEFVRCSLKRVLEGSAADGVGHVRDLAENAQNRTDDAFEQYMRERAANALDPQTGAFLIASGTHAMLVGDVVNDLADTESLAYGCGNGTITLDAQMRVMIAGYQRLADELSKGTSDEPPANAVREDTLHEAALVCLRSWNEDHSEGHAAVAVIWIGEWIRQLSTLSADLEEPVAAAVKATASAWWH